MLEESAEYDLGRCSENDLDTIWAVGNLAAERPAATASREPGRTVVIVKMEGDVAGGMGEGTADPDRSAEAILDESWDDIVHVARLLIDRGALSRATSKPKYWRPSEPRWRPGARSVNRIHDRTHAPEALNHANRR